jgi:hypothetical protein
MMTSHTIAVHITVDDQSHPAAVSELLSELSFRFKEVTRAEFMLGGQRWGGAETLNVRKVKTAADVVGARQEAPGGPTGSRTGPS